MSELRKAMEGKRPGPRSRAHEITQRLIAVRVRTEPAFEAGSPEALFTGSYGLAIGRMYDIAPDAQKFLMIRPARTTEDGPGDHVILVQNWFEELKRLVPTD